MKENFEQFREQVGKTESEKDIELSVEAQTHAEETVKEFKDAFKELHGSYPNQTETEKILKGVKAVLEIDLREGDESHSDEVIIKAIERIESDQQITDVRKFFENYDRRETRRN